MAEVAPGCIGDIQAAVAVEIVENYNNDVQSVLEKKIASRSN